jgi:site-specific recombinase XerD
MEVRERELKRYFAKLSPAKNKKLPLFISTYGADADKPESFLMGAKTIWRAINELSAEVHLHPHLLRHSYALDLLDSSKDVRLVAQALGHSDVRVTMRYTERSGEEVAAALEKSRQSDKK